LQRVTGWNYGLRSAQFGSPYEWLDNDHVMLFSVIGEVTSTHGISEDTVPVVYDLKSADLWLPLETKKRIDADRAVVWSNAVQKLIVAGDEEVTLYEADGTVAGRMPGSAPLALSPSGKRLVTGDSWYDLTSGQVTVLDQAVPLVHATWSRVEDQLFECCFKYVDAGRELATEFVLDDLFSAAEEYSAAPELARSQFVLNDSRVLVQWNFDSPAAFGVIPLIDPVEGRYQDVRERVGLDVNGYCGPPVIAPRGDRLFVQCAPDTIDAAEQLAGSFYTWATGQGTLSLTTSLTATSYLIDLRSSSRQAVASDLQFMSWSPDGAQALFAKRVVDWDERQGEYVLLPIKDLSSGLPLKAVPLAVQVIRSPTWRSDGAQLAFLSETGTTLTIMTLPESQPVTVPLTQPGRSLIWHPEGKGLAVLAEDGSLWWIADPAIGLVEQLTPSLPEVRALQWSPNGDKLAFVSGPDVYVVTVSQ
jgi:dipeptidyl aminopeptidase/acylaminoacyl peptidase